MNNKISTKMITEISLLIAVGVVLKLVTDILFRTGLSFLFIDLTMIATVIILYRYPTFKVALIVGFIQAGLSAMIFTTTDIWFIRPIIAILAYLFIRMTKKRKSSFVLSVFLTSKFTVLTVSLVLVITVLLFPQMVNFESIFGNAELISGDPLVSQMIEENFILIMIVSAVLLGLIYAYIPAFANMFVAWLFYKFVGRRIFKENTPDNKEEIREEKKEESTPEKPLD